mmetsp:Transcript_24754/g.64630  ORF Transcript_24754/g.64630 Transcript_24754/m.64630 type:complete len:463 (+) Transcript_24754:186-1574(+)
MHSLPDLKGQPASALLGNHRFARVVVLSQQAPDVVPGTAKAPDVQVQVPDALCGVAVRDLQAHLPEAQPLRPRPAGVPGAEAEPARLLRLRPRAGDVQLLEVELGARPAQPLRLRLHAEQCGLDAARLPGDVDQDVLAGFHQVEPLAVEVLEVGIAGGGHGAPPANPAHRGSTGGRRLDRRGQSRPLAGEAREPRRNIDRVAAPAWAAGAAPRSPVVGANHLAGGAVAVSHDLGSIVPPRGAPLSCLGVRTELVAQAVEVVVVLPRGRQSVRDLVATSDCNPSSVVRVPPVEDQPTVGAKDWVSRDAVPIERRWHVRPDVGVRGAAISRRIYPPWVQVVEVILHREELGELPRLGHLACTVRVSSDRDVLHWGGPHSAVDEIVCKGCGSASSTAGPGPSVPHVRTIARVDVCKQHPGVLGRRSWRRRIRRAGRRAGRRECGRAWRWAGRRVRRWVRRRIWRS